MVKRYGDNRRRRMSEAARNRDNEIYVVFRKDKNPYSGGWDFIAVTYGKGALSNFGRLHATICDGEMPYHMGLSIYHDEIDMGYYWKTKPFRPGEEGYDEFYEIVMREIKEDGFIPVVRQKIDYNSVEADW